MADWKLSKRREVCGRCERPFGEDEPLFSCLLVRDGDLGREDLCRGCFDAGAEGREDLIFWRGRYRVGKKAFAVDFEALEALFLALEEREDQALRELRYLLALLLMRKKRLKLLRTARRDGEEAMVLRRPRRTEELLVFVYDLSPDRAEELRGKLRSIFEGAALEELLAGPAEGGDDSGPGEAADAPVEPEETEKAGEAGPGVEDPVKPSRAPEATEPSA